MNLHETGKRSNLVAEPGNTKQKAKSLDPTEAHIY